MIHMSSGWQAEIISGAYLDPSHSALVHRLRTAEKYRQWQKYTTPVQNPSINTTVERRSGDSEDWWMVLICA